MCIIVIIRASMLKTLKFNCTDIVIAFLNCHKVFGNSQNFHSNLWVLASSFGVFTLAQKNLHHVN